jgi:hypothetical protein
MLGLYSKLILLAVVVGGVFLFKNHYDNLVDERDQLMASHALAEAAHATTKASFNSYRTEATRRLNEVEAALGRLDQAYKAAKEQTDETSKTLSAHDFGYLAKSKPGLVGNIINRGTARMFDELEKATGRGPRSDISPDGKSRVSTTGAGEYGPGGVGSFII